MIKVVRIGKEVVTNCHGMVFGIVQKMTIQRIRKKPHKSRTHPSHPWKQNNMMTRRNNNMQGNLKQHNKNNSNNV